MNYKVEFPPLHSHKFQLSEVPRGFLEQKVMKRTFVEAVQFGTMNDENEPQFDVQSQEHTLNYEVDFPALHSLKSSETQLSEVPRGFLGQNLMKRTFVEAVQCGTKNDEIVQSQELMETSYPALKKKVQFVENCQEKPQSKSNNSVPPSQIDASYMKFEILASKLITGFEGKKSNLMMDQLCRQKDQLETLYVSLLHESYTSDDQILAFSIELNKVLQKINFANVEERKRTSSLSKRLRYVFKCKIDSQG